MMRLSIPALSLCLSACGSMGLDAIGGDSASTISGSPWLVIDPPGTVDFGSVDVAGNSAIETLTLVAKGPAGQKVIIIDIRLGALTYSAYSLASSDLPLPHQLPVDVDYPVDVYFLPNAVAPFTGTVEIDIENEEGGVETVGRDLIGVGCDSSTPQGCS